MTNPHEQDYPWLPRIADGSMGYPPWLATWVPAKCSGRHQSSQSERCQRPVGEHDQRRTVDAQPSQRAPALARRARLHLVLHHRAGMSLQTIANSLGVKISDVERMLSTSKPDA